KKEKYLDFLQAQESSFQIAQTSNQDEQRELYKTLDKLMSKSRDDYFLKRAIYYRSLMNFLNSNNYFYAGFVVTNWYRYTKLDELEYAYDMDQFIYQSMNKAYGFLAENKNSYAQGEFFGVLNATNDLSAHLAYIQV